MSAPVLVNKQSLALWLGISLPTLSAWMLRYGADFPIVERGSNGRDYKFDAAAVADFLRAKRDEQAAARDQAAAQRDEQLAQLRLPFDLPGVEAPPKASSAKDEIEAWKLRRIQREEAERAGALVPAAQVADSFRAAFGRLSRDMHAFVRQIGREQGWPDPLVRQLERRLSDQQRASVEAIRHALDTGALIEADRAVG